MGVHTLHLAEGVGKHSGSGELLLDPADHLLDALNLSADLPAACLRSGDAKAELVVLFVADDDMA